MMIFGRLFGRSKKKAMMDATATAMAFCSKGWVDAIWDNDEVVGFWLQRRPTDEMEHNFLKMLCAFSETDHKGALTGFLRGHKIPESVESRFYAGDYVIREDPERGGYQAVPC